MPPTDHHPRTAGESVARSELVMRQRLGGRARPPAALSDGQAAARQAAQAGARLESGSSGREATASTQWTAVSADTTRARRIDRRCSHCSRCCTGCQSAASAAPHEYHALVDVTRPLPWVGHRSGGACASKDARTQRPPGQQTPTSSIEPAESALVARNFGGLFKYRHEQKKRRQGYLRHREDLPYAGVSIAQHAANPSRALPPRSPRSRRQVSQVCREVDPDDLWRPLHSPYT